MGHDGGDHLLTQLGQRLISGVRHFDTVARFGGDEFMVILPRIGNLADVRKLADRIMEAFVMPIKVKDQEFFITASMGISIYPLDGEGMSDLIKNADLAMYTSKQSGKNRYTLCSSEMKEEFLMNTELTNSLYRALERNELALYYQPVIDSCTGKIVELEALLRWNHPEKGMIPPSVFIPIAESTGLINTIGHWALYVACLQNKAWQNKGLPPLRVAVNLSIGQFLTPKLVEIVSSILDQSGLDPCYLGLEITESIAMHERDFIVETFNRLKALGVMLSIDDFGTEYSSLSRLKDLPVDNIKIDMQFIHGIAVEGCKEEGIIKVILRLGKSLGLRVVAEGVETKEQLLFLNENACDLVQGFYFYEPMSADEIEKLLVGMKERADV